MCPGKLVKKRWASGCWPSFVELTDWALDMLTRSNQAIWMYYWPQD